MTATNTTAHPEPRPPTFDRLAVLEMVGVLILGDTLFGLLTLNLVHGIRDGNAYSGTTVLMSSLIGLGGGLALVAGMVWTWHRTGGRPAQRLGRRAWRSGRLPSGQPARERIRSDLQRRWNVLTRMSATMQLVLAGVFTLLVIVQLATGHPLIPSLAWILLAAVQAGSGIRGAYDRRHLPQLRALLEDDAPAGSND